MTALSRYCTIIEKREVDRFILGPVLIPDVRDSQGDMCSSRDIEKAAWDFLPNSSVVGEMHTKSFAKADAVVVESYIARAPLLLSGFEVPAGTWLIGMKLSPELWKRVQDGTFTGFSIGGSARRLVEREE